MTVFLNLEIVYELETYRDNGNDGAVLFVDEIHRWTTTQQDALLPHVESGLICLIEPLLKTLIVQLIKH